jgi:hypothetical protein
VGGAYCTLESSLECASLLDTSIKTTVTVVLSFVERAMIHLIYTFFLFGFGHILPLSFITKVAI